MASKKLSLSSFSSFLFFFHLTLLLSLSVVSSSELNNNLPLGSLSNYRIDGRDWIDLHRREWSVSIKNILEGSFVLNFTNQLSVVDTVTSYSTAMRTSSAVRSPRGGKLLARHLSSLGRGYRRPYDFFLFTQQWPGADHFRCEPTYHIDIRDFKIHGLWPQYYWGGSPKNCDPHDYFKESEVVSLIHYLEQAWPDISCLSENGRSFWAYQWRKHGTFSNHVFNQYSYFRAALQLKYHLDLLSILENQGIVPDDYTYYSLDRINRAIATWTGHYPARTRCEIDPYTLEASRLMEIGVCRLSSTPVHLVFESLLDDMHG